MHYESSLLRLIEQQIPDDYRHDPQVAGAFLDGWLAATLFADREITVLVAANAQGMGGKVWSAYRAGLKAGAGYFDG